MWRLRCPSPHNGSGDLGRIGLRLAGNPKLLNGRIDIQIGDMAPEPGSARLVDNAVDGEVLPGKRAPDWQEQPGREIDGLGDELLSSAAYASSHKTLNLALVTGAQADSSRRSARKYSLRSARTSS